MNQVQAVKSHLLSGKSITSMEAFEKWGCTRLSDKIFRLRKSGMDIVTIDRPITDRFGETKTYAEYRLGASYYAQHGQNSK